MLHVLQSAARPASDAVLRAMFAARKSVFVDLLKWDVPVLDGAYEVDQFDDVHATYLILAEPDGTHLGSARLLPTTRPHILDSFYAGLCEDAPPRDADIFEITRFCLDRRLTAHERRHVRDTLVSALVDHALATGIAAYSAIAVMGWFQQILAFGWHCMPLGLPRVIDGTMLAALRIEITPETPSLLESGRSTAATLRVDRRVAA
ncbi:acyl-homoserine-lactone synthase [Sphingomonas sp. BE137]|jgi:N-acyl-L-homoserine lactone synthetase|uniref:acyl-homoserine-lactone synthase n=1 Tax=Sphingomonas sp. BE137 TaxID=2817844 RepID=UPI001AE1C233|nr:acyl-homoserine-lactone synthase [Sphingomonas sp. BE137]MDR6846922.1 acyl-homoserine lactone synthase [Sphingomonas sp. BE137]